MAIELLRFSTADVDRLISWVPSPDFLFQWAGVSYQFPLTQEQIEEFLALGDGAEPEVMMYKAVRPGAGNEADDVVGHVDLLNIDRHNRSLTIGRVLVGDANSRGRGIGKEIVRSALRIAFDELGMHRVGLGVFSHNTAALACYEGVGFRREGTLRDYRRYGDQYLDLIMMSMLEEEWRATRPKPAL